MLSSMHASTFVDVDIPWRRIDHGSMAINPFNPGYYESEELRGFGFGAIGEQVLISRDCTIIGPERIFIGDNVRIDSNVSIIATGGRLSLAGHNHIGGGTHLCVAADLIIGRHSGFSQGVKIYTSTDDYSGDWLAGPNIPAEYRQCCTLPITIGNYCVVGAGSIFMPGCSAADGAAVGAISLVTKPLEAWTLYHGNPARRIRSRSHRAAVLGAQLAGEPVLETLHPSFDEMRGAA